MDKRELLYKVMILEKQGFYPSRHVNKYSDIEEIKHVLRLQELKRIQVQIKHAEDILSRKISHTR